MKKTLYYPALFFADIVEYYGNSSTYIEEIIKHNIVQTKRTKLVELKSEVESLHIVTSKTKDDKKGTGLLDELKSIKKRKTDQNKIKGIDKAISMAKAMDKIDTDIMDEVLSVIQTLSEEKAGRNGYSDTNIDRYIDAEKNALEERNYHDIINYLIEPQAEGDYKTLAASLLDCINGSKYNDLPQDKKRSINNYLCASDFKSVFVLRIFKILEKCSIGFSNNVIDTSRKKKTTEFENEINILEKFRSVLINIWGQADAEGVGISQREKDEIIFRASNELLQDYKLYSDIYKCSDFENSKGFQALIFYRLYNQIYYYKKIENCLNSEISEELDKALAFFSFSILQRAVEHTEILLHPASRISAPVYIGNGVMVGKQCRLEPECILGNNVCLYPFNVYNTNVKKKDIYIQIGRGTIFGENVKAVGSIRVGEKCIIKRSILVENNLEGNMLIDNNGMTKLEKEDYVNAKMELTGGIL